MERLQAGKSQVWWDQDCRNPFALAHDAILDCEPHSDVELELIASACEIICTPRERFVGMNSSDLSRDIKYRERDMRRLLAQDQYGGFETLQYRSDGTPSTASSTRRASTSGGARPS